MLLSKKIFICFLFISFSITSVFAEDFSTTNIQLLYGTHFDDFYAGNNTLNGNMTTVTFEHFGTWKYGDNFFFADLTSGDFLDFENQPSGIQYMGYFEWSPRLSIPQILNKEFNMGIVSNFYLAGEFSRAHGFYADLFGIGLDLTIPLFNAFSLNLFHREDSFNRDQFQATFVWAAPFKIKGLNCNFTGYTDIATTELDGTDIFAQPQLVIDLSSLTKNIIPGLEAGVEWYYHRNDLVDVSLPQALLKWTW